MRSNPTTDKNLETRELIHPSGFRTSGFPVYEPTKQQIESAARRAQDDPSPFPRRRVSRLEKILWTIGLVLLAYAGSYLVVRVFA